MSFRPLWCDTRNYGAYLPAIVLQNMRGNCMLEGPDFGGSSTLKREELLASYQVKWMSTWSIDWFTALGCVVPSLNEHSCRTGCIVFVVSSFVTYTTWHHPGGSSNIDSRVVPSPCRRWARGNAIAHRPSGL